MRLVTSPNQAPWGRVVSVEGDVDHLEGRRLFDELYHALTGPLIIDVTAMDFIDTGGLAAILEVLKYARERGEPIILAGPKPHIRRAFHFAGLDNLAPWLILTDGLEEAKEAVLRLRRRAAIPRAVNGMRYRSQRLSVALPRRTMSRASPTTT